MKVAIMAISCEDSFNSHQTKYLHKIIDKPMIAYSIERAANFSSDIVVVANANDKLKSAAEGLGAKFVEVAAANEFFSAFGDEPVLVIQGDDSAFYTDQPNLSPPPGPREMINQLLLLHKSSDSPATYIKLDEYTQSVSFNFMLTPSQINLEPRYSVPYVVAARHFAPLEEVLKSHPSAEPFVVNYYFQSRVLTRLDFAAAISAVNSSSVVRLAKAGATIMYSSIIGADVTAEQDVIIYPNVEITGKTHIGNGTVIRSGSRLHNMTIGSGCEIEQSVLTDSTIGDNTCVGPFAYIRPGSRIGSNCRIGDFVEIKNSTIGDNSKASHLGYIGDSVVGSNVNFGCGSITVNYDGANKSATVIEDGAFIGSNSNLVAPVRLGKNSFVAAGSTITRDVPSGELAIGRQRQENKQGWNRPSKKS